MRRPLLYVLAVALAAASLVPTADAARPRGKVHVKTPGLAIVLQATVRQTVMVRSGSPAILYAGTYPVKAVLYHVTEEERRRVWRLDSWTSVGELKEVEVRPNETTTVTGGGVITLVPKPSVRKGNNHRYVTVRLIARDARGVVYHPRAKCGRRYGPLQEIALCTPSGKVVSKAEAKPEYG